jgi:hypothetical protein
MIEIYGTRCDLAGATSDMDDSREQNSTIVKPNPTIPTDVRTHAMNVRSRARRVRSHAK